jgi:hypothetical protein
MDKKKIFEGLMLYLKLRYKNEPILLDYKMINTQIDDKDFGSSKIPSNFVDFIEIIIYDNIDEIRDESYSEVSDWYRLNVELDQTKGEIRFTSESYEYEENPSEYGDETSEEEKEILNDLGITSISVKYDGYGDSGDIEDTGETNNGDTVTISDSLLTVLYNRLSDAYGGWENNEGSYGTIDMTNDEITIGHIWKEEVLMETPLDLVITKDDLLA